jgi:hypothetical protein
MLSISDIRIDIEQIIQAAEAAVLKMHYAIAAFWRALLPDIKQEIKPWILQKSLSVGLQ